MWVLIITAFTVGNSGISVSPAPAFTGKQTCVSAGMNVQSDIHRREPRTRVYYQCSKM